MAEIPRLQSGRVQVQGVSSLPQPNMNFGQQRPEVEFQAAAEGSSTLSRTLSNLSSQMFGLAQNMAEDAGARFVAENPTKLEDLQAAADGNVEKFKRDFSLNAFGAAVNKFKATELSAYLESQLVNDANSLQLKVETGKDESGNAYDIDVAKLSADWKSKVDGYSGSLASVSPEASYKLRATAAVHGNRLLLAAAKAQNQKALAQAKVYIVKDVNDYANSVSNILRGERVTDERTGQILGFEESLLYERKRLLNNSLARGGIDGQSFALEQSEKIELEVKTTVFENAVLYRKGDLGGDLVSFNDKVRNRTLPEDLQAVWDSMTQPQQKSARDKIVAQYQQLIDIKNKDREFNKQDSVINANRLKLTYLDPNASEATRQDVISQLKEISARYPEIIDAKTIYEMPKMLKETAEDDFDGVAKLTQRLRDKDVLLTTPTEILDAARALGVTPKTALELSERYLPKDAKEADRLNKTIEVEYLLRTKLPDGITKKRIATLDDLKNSLQVRNLSLADAPSNYIQLLTAPAEVGDDDSDAVNAITDQIDNNYITSAVGVSQAAKGKRIKPETIISLGKRVGDRRLQLETAADKTGGRIADASGSQSPTTKARLKLEGSEDTKREHQKLMADWESKGRVGPPPSIQDAGDIVERRYLDKKDKDRITAAQQSIVSNFGPNGSMMPPAAREMQINLPAIPPKFKPGAVVEVTPEYRRALEAEFKRAGVEERKYRPIVDEIIQQQTFIEKTIRSRSNR